jgi:hypothetical protein
MPASRVSEIRRSGDDPWRRRCGAGAALACVLLLTVPAPAQDGGTTGADTPPAEIAAPAPQPVKPPGLLDAVSRWLKESTFNLKPKSREPPVAPDETVKEADRAVRDAADAVGSVMRLPVSRVVNANERCEVAPNGAPDCRTTAIAVCRKNGFAGGRTVDIYSAHKCPPEFWQTRRTPSEPDCTVETFVSKAACQ